MHEEATDIEKYCIAIYKEKIQKEFHLCSIIDQKPRKTIRIIQ